MLKLETMICNLPEDVLKRRWAGDFEGEIALIDALLAKDIPEMLRERLKIERRMAELLPVRYCYSRQDALKLLHERVEGFKDEELEALELDRAVEYIYIRGEKRYLRSFINSLPKTRPDYAPRMGIASGANRPMLDGAIAEMKQSGRLAYRIALKGVLTIGEAAFVPGTKVRIHMPVPQRCAQQSEIEVKTGYASLDSEDALQRTVYFEGEMQENAPFEVAYSYKNEVRYVDPLSADKPAGVVYPAAPAPTADDLREHLPHIAFTPFLRALAKELMGEETDPARIAWRFYEYITTKIRYSFMRSYFLIENQAEYCALNGKGDCGIQAILFITLCRIAGIPARWQSGLAVEEKSAGCHDWAQFYVEPYGWLFCDPSFGGSAYRAGAEERWRFYFGNLDPFRMVANSRYQTGFNPPKLYDRADPYDSQEGEVEINGAGLSGYQFDTVYETTQFEKLD